MAASERLCDGPCGRLLPDDDLTPAPYDPNRRLCDTCYDTDPNVLDYLIPERWPRGDDGLAPPLGEPGEAGRSDAA